MTETKKKKQLLDENTDMFISEYDKNLSYDALKQIVDAKKDYANAAKADDKKGMTKANNVANAVRAKYGNYTAGDFGDEYHPFAYGDVRYDDYKSKYEDELDSLYDSLNIKSKEFSYNYENDPAYKAYKSVYENQGRLAYERALAENSLKTGGMENSNAQSAAMQALNYYNSQLALKIPELYEAAYDRYYSNEMQKYNKLKDAYSLVSDREKRDYTRHLDKLDTQRDIRDYLYNQSQNAMDMAFKREQNEYDRDLSSEKYSADKAKNALGIIYDLYNDTIDNEKWRYEYNKSASKAGYPAYTGSIGTDDLLGYTKKMFGNENITLEDLYRLLGL
jgi:hypothetical protein